LKVYAEKYAEDQDAFFKDYAEAHAKLSNLGAKFDPPKVRIKTIPILERYRIIILLGYVTWYSLNVAGYLT
jgi:hypothetical protein